MIGLIFDDSSLIVVGEKPEELTKFREKLSSRIQELEQTAFFIEIDHEVFVDLTPSSEYAFLARGALGATAVEGVLRMGGRQVVDLRGLEFCGNCRVEHEPRTCPHRPRLSRTEPATR